MSNKTYAIGTVKVTKWDNGDKQDSFTFKKSYKDGEEWKDTDSYFRDDLLKLRAVIDKLLIEEVKEY